MSTTGINQNYFSISKNLKYWFSDNFQFFMNTVLAISSKPFELQTSVFYTRQTILSSLRVIETKLDDRCTVWELWRHKHLADLIFSENLTLSRFIKVNYTHWTIVMYTVRFEIRLWSKTGVDYFSIFYGFRENRIYVLQGPKIRFPPIFDPLGKPCPPPRNFVKLFFTSSRTYLEVI